jgi:hypothetical protein
VDDENQTHTRLDIWIVSIKKRKLLLHSVPAVQQTRCFLLMALYILCTLSGVCKSCTHTHHHTEGMARATAAILPHDFLNTSIGNAPMTANRQKSLLLFTD